MIIIFILILILSTIGEYLPLPGFQTNQLFILVLVPIVIFKIKKRISYYPHNVVLVILLFLWFYITLQGLLSTYDINAFLRTMREYSISFIFILMVICLKVDEYRTILKKFTSFCNVFFMFEYILGTSNVGHIYNTFFHQPYADIRNMANFLSPNSYGAVIAFLIISNIYLYCHYKNKMNLLFSLLLIFPLVTTVSRSSLIVLILGLLVFVFIKFKIAVKFAILIAVLWLSLISVSDRIVVWLSQYSDSYFARRIVLYFQSDSVFGNRIYEYEIIFNLYKSNWFTGLGFGNITGKNQLYSGMTSMHNEYLRFFIEAGIVGGALFMIIIVFLIYAAIKLVLSREYDRNIKALFASFTIMFLVSQLQYNYFNAPREGILLIFFGFSALTVFTKTKINVNKSNTTPLLYVRAGVLAKQIGCVCECGMPLKENFDCKDCGRS
jgi:O-antigen ligase